MEAPKNLLKIPSSKRGNTVIRAGRIIGNSSSVKGPSISFHARIKPKKWSVIPTNPTKPASRSRKYVELKQKKATEPFSIQDCQAKLDELNRQAKVAARFKPIRYFSDKEMKSTLKLKTVQLLPNKYAPASKLGTSCFFRRPRSGSLDSLQASYSASAVAFLGLENLENLLSLGRANYEAFVKGKKRIKKKTFKEIVSGEDFRAELTRANLDFHNRTRIFDQSGIHTTWTPALARVKGDVAGKSKPAIPKHFFPALSPRVPNIHILPLRVKTNARRVRDKLNGIIQKDRNPNNVFHLRDHRYLELLETLTPCCKRNEFIKVAENKTGEDGYRKIRFVKKHTNTKTGKKKVYTTKKEGSSPKGNG